MGPEVSPLPLKLRFRRLCLDLDSTAKNRKRKCARLLCVPLQCVKATEVQELITSYMRVCRAKGLKYETQTIDQRSGFFCMVVLCLPPSIRVLHHFNIERPLAAVLRVLSATSFGFWILAIRELLRSTGVIEGIRCLGLSRTSVDEDSAVASL